MRELQRKFYNFHNEKTYKCKQMRHTANNTKYSIYDEQNENIVQKSKSKNETSEDDVFSCGMFDS